MMATNNQSSGADVLKENRPVAESGGRGIIARARDIARVASWRKNDSDRKPVKEVSLHRPAQRRASVDCGNAKSSYNEYESHQDTYLPSKMRCGPPTRHVSSDNLEPLHGMSRRDDLSAATLHGSTDVSRVRSKKSSDKESIKVSKTAKGDRRSQMKRAMSRENVKPPEEYGPNSTATAVTKSHNAQKSIAGGLYGNSPEPRRGRRKPVKSSKCSSDSEDLDVEPTVDHSEVDSSEGSFAEEDDIVQKRPVVTSTLRKKSSLQTAHRRDLLSLLRDKKTVQVSDMKDRDNRRILHFLIYQHSLNVDLTELQASVDHDIAVNGSAALYRPPLPLYVEPPN